jgi:hypothetical protein
MLRVIFGIIYVFKKSASRLTKLTRVEKETTLYEIRESIKIYVSYLIDVNLNLSLKKALFG